MDASLRRQFVQATETLSTRVHIQIICKSAHFVVVVNLPILATSNKRELDWPLSFGAGLVLRMFGHMPAHLCR